MFGIMPFIALINPEDTINVLSGLIKKRTNNTAAAIVIVLGAPKPNRRPTTATAHTNNGKLKKPIKSMIKIEPTISAHIGASPVKNPW